jgi:predicted alpha/beta-hydrolase family hydrolase
LARSRALRFRAGGSAGELEALVERPPDATCGFVLAHGAGAGMRHPFLEAIAGRLAACRIATFRYQFPYMERGSRRPDPPRVLVASVRAAVAEAREALPGLPLLAGGKSLGGRMTSLACAEQALPAVSALVFLGFPLHAAGRPSAERGAHLQQVPLPMLFLQGGRDRLADLSLLRPLCARLGERAQLWVLEEGDHSFRVPKRAGLAESEVLNRLAERIAGFAAGVAAASP